MKIKQVETSYQQRVRFSFVIKCNAYDQAVKESSPHAIRNAHDDDRDEQEVERGFRLQVEDRARYREHCETGARVAYFAVIWQDVSWSESRVVSRSEYEWGGRCRRDEGTMNRSTNYPEIIESKRRSPTHPRHDILDPISSRRRIPNSALSLVILHRPLVLPVHLIRMRVRFDRPEVGLARVRVLARIRAIVLLGGRHACCWDRP